MLRSFLSWFRFKNPKQTREIAIVLIFLFLVGGFTYLLFRFNDSEIKETLGFDMRYAGSVGEKVLEDFQSKNTLPVIQETQEDENGKEKAFFVVKAPKEAGIQIDFANKNDTSGLMAPEAIDQEMSVAFPENYAEPMQIRLDRERVITIRDQHADANYSARVLKPTLVQSKDDKSDALKKIQQSETGVDKEVLPASFLSYQSKDKRKTAYYGYQTDAATGEQKLKNWLLYRSGNGEENEAYTFENAKLRANGDGSVSVFYFGQKELQNEQVAADVDQDLLERARRVLEKDMGEDILNGRTEPDFTIPKPYFIDAQGKRQDLEWKVDEEGKSLKLHFSVTLSQYPLALDPTLQFTAPGQSNSGSAITGEAVSNNFGYALAAGDFNADGTTDLAVGAQGYSTNTGRAYIFYNDGSIPTTAATADVTITGEATSNLFGASLASGDFNADGTTDLAVGAYDYNFSTGRVYIFHNDGSIPTTAATADVTITGETTSNFFGRSLAAGDFNADGKTDLAIGAYGYSSSTGRVYIFHNDGSIPTTAATADVTITGETTSNYFGASLTAGDFNADGKIDLAVGAQGYSSFTGRAYIFHNDGSIPTTAATADVIITGESTLNFFSITLTAGDFNADGTTDLAVGAYDYNFSTGRVYIFHNDGSIPTTAATADVTITGDAVDDLFGTSLAAGDFNADGKTDLAAGAYGYSTNTGRVYIFHNDGSIPTTTATADVIITGETTNNYFGYALTAGDFNADGKTDLVVGAHSYASSRGRAYIFYSQNGQVNTNQNITGETTNNYFGYALTAGDFNADGKTDLAAGAYGYSTNTGRVYIFHNDGSIPTTAATADVTITGETTSNYFGSSLSSGDFNADGKTDLAVGAQGYSTNTGRVYIFHNDGSIPTTAATADVTITGETTSNNFGASLTAGDFNADGTTDLAVGARNYNSSTGRVYIFHNDGSIPTTAATADVTITGETTNNYFGYALTAGDFNADGTIDLAVSAYRYDTNTGRVYIFHNDGSIPTTAATADVTITGETTSNNFGASLTAGDFNADGKTDLAVGAQGYSTNTGRVYIFHNDGSIPTTAATADVTITGETTSNLFGISLIAGDFNADGKTDLAVGAQGYSTNTGRVYIFHNDGSIPTTAATADVTITGETTSNFFGRSLAAGDFNADGKTDLAIGAYGYSSSTGRVYLYETRDNFSWQLQEIQSPDNLRVNTNTSGQEMKITGGATSNNFGHALTSGDFNADGKIDLAVGAYGYSSNTGRVYIFHNDGSIPTTATTADVTITGESTSNNFGISLTPGDFNADGTIDLAVGAYAYSSSTGRVYIFHNDGSIPTTAATADVTITGETTSNNFGFSLASGDFNADGKTDLAVGAYGYSSSTGRAYIFHNDGSIPTTAATADVTITGGATSNFFGYSLTSGDFNADGTIDLAVGAYAYSSSTGRVYIFHNDGSIPTTAATADVTITGETTSNNFGFSLVSGDFNADGKTDLAVGASGYSSSTGRAYIFHNDGSIPTTAGTADVTITGGANFNQFGRFITSGDFNADGRVDLAVGAPFYTSSTGRVYIFHNDGSIPTTAATADVTITGETTSNFFGASLASVDLNRDGQTDLVVGAYRYNSFTGRTYIYTFNDPVISGETTNNYFGYALTAGDFNADGKTDLAVGAHGYSTNTGRAYIFYNDGSIPTTAATADVTITGEATSNLFGASLASGDFNADGKTDLAVGAYGYSSSTGRVYIFHNDGSIPTTAATADVTITGETTSNYFGASLTAGDFNADSKTDLAVSAYRYNTTTGRAYIFHNDGSIPTTAATADVIITGETTSNYFGISLAAGDFNADGKTDLAVGAHGYSTNTGRAYIFYNDGSIPTTAATADVTITGEATSNLFGASLASGDFNADGTTDLAVGAQGYSTNTGRAYIFYNDGSIPTTAATADVIITGETTSNYFGSSLSSGDFNADGKTDLAVGAYDYNFSTGRVYIFHNDGSIPTTAATADVTITGETTSNFFGRSLAAGDFNADGKTDLAVGAYGYGSSAGRVYIFTTEAKVIAEASNTLRGTSTFRGTVKLR
jgi:hypothetical protein